MDDFFWSDINKFMRRVSATLKKEQNKKAIFSTGLKMVPIV